MDTVKVDLQLLAEDMWKQKEAKLEEAIPMQLQATVPEIKQAFGQGDNPTRGTAPLYSAYSI